MTPLGLAVSRVRRPSRGGLVPGAGAEQRPNNDCACRSVRCDRGEVLDARHAALRSGPTPAHNLTQRHLKLAADAHGMARAGRPTLRRGAI